MRLLTALRLISPVPPSLLFCRPPVTPNTIIYHGGPVMRDPINVYLVWVGDWSAKSATQTVLRNLVNSLGGSPYWAINTAYYDTVGVVSSVLNVTGELSLPSVTSLTNDQAVFNAINSGLSAKTFPVDTAGVYVVLSASSVTTTGLGFCSNFCGYHTWYPYTSSAGVTTTIHAAFVGDTSACGGCKAAALTATSAPNGDVAGDAMASTLAHELAEVATDPTGSSWYTASGSENADICAWQFGASSTVPGTTGTVYNVQLKNFYFYLQQNWKITGGCSLTP